MSATVKDVMTIRVVAVRKNAPFKDIAALLTRHRVSAFPVLDDDGTVIGVVSEADLLCKEALTAAMGRAGRTARAVSRRFRPGGRGHRRRPDDHAAGHHYARRTRHQRRPPYVQRQGETTSGGQ